MIRISPFFMIRGMKHGQERKGTGIFIWIEISRRYREYRRWMKKQEPKIEEYSKFYKIYHKRLPPKHGRDYEVYLREELQNLYLVKEDLLYLLNHNQEIINSKGFKSNYKIKGSKDGNEPECICMEGYIMKDEKDKKFIHLYIHSAIHPKFIMKLQELRELDSFVIPWDNFDLQLFIRNSYSNLNSMRSKYNINGEIPSKGSTKMKKLQTFDKHGNKIE